MITIKVIFVQEYCGNRSLHTKESCDSCNDLCDNKGQLETHIKTIDGECELQECNKCELLFERKKRRRQILSDRFQCNQCEKSYKVKVELKKHIDKIHRGLKYQCEECPDVLSSSQSLRRHIRNVHELVLRSSRCDVCGKCFKEIDHLRKHMKIHEDATKSFVCQSCGKLLKNNASLRTHIRIMHERNFKKTCEECGKRFPNMHNLKIHMEMVHLKGELFMCQICGKEMIGKNRLRNHMMTHPKGQKFVTCDQCGKVGLPKTVVGFVVQDIRTKIIILFMRKLSQRTFSLYF